MADKSIVYDQAILDHKEDLYGGVIIAPEGIPGEPKEFEELLSQSLRIWREKSKRGVWLKIPTSKVGLIEPATKQGFEFHSAERGYVMMTIWLPVGMSVGAPGGTPSSVPNGMAGEMPNGPPVVQEDPYNLPPPASHQVGVGAFVLNKNNEVLVVQERRGPGARIPDFWKLPTGLVDKGEALGDAVVREVLEETGVHVELCCVLSMRESHNIGMQGQSDLFFTCACRPLSEEIHIQESEIAAAKWISIEEYMKFDFIKGSLLTNLMEQGIMYFRGEYVGMKPEWVPLGLSSDRMQMLYHSAIIKNVNYVQISEELVSKH